MLSDSTYFSYSNPEPISLPLVASPSSHLNSPTRYEGGIPSDLLSCAYNVASKAGPQLAADESPAALSLRVAGHSASRIPNVPAYRHDAIANE